jgi:hypothetical protein
VQKDRLNLIAFEVNTFFHDEGMKASWPSFYARDLFPSPPTIRESEIQIGFQISPIPPAKLNLQGKNRALVGLGSYIINAQGGCNDCHTCPSYKPGHNPFPPTLSDGQINKQFKNVMRTGFDPVDRMTLSRDAVADLSQYDGSGP